MRRAVSAALAGLVLAGCVPGVDVARSAPPSRIALAGAGLVISGPPGYCIDRTASRLDGAGGAFVLMGSCASIAGDARAASPDLPAIVTVTVGGRTAGDITAQLDGLAAFVRTEDGRATLARSGDPGEIEILETRIEEEALLIRARDVAKAGKGMDAEYWRALFGVNGRLLTASVAGFDDRPLPAGAGRAILTDLARQIRAESAGRAG